LKDIDAQHAILLSAVRLINQLRQHTTQKIEQNESFGPWVYNMNGLQKWIHHYTERRRLHCPKCKADTTFTCQTCNEVYEYHDEL
jgi:hypothetical protein